MGGTAASITNSSGTVTVSGLTDVPSAAVGEQMYIFDATGANNGGPFPILTVTPPSSVTINNPSSPAGADPNNGSIGWAIDWGSNANTTPEPEYANPRRDGPRQTVYNITGNQGGLPPPTPSGPTRYYALRASCTSAPSGFITWVNETGDNTGRPGCSGTLGPTQIEATWLS